MKKAWILLSILALVLPQTANTEPKRKKKKRTNTSQVGHSNKRRRTSLYAQSKDVDSAKLTIPGIDDPSFLLDPDEEIAVKPKINFDELPPPPPKVVASMVADFRPALPPPKAFLERREEQAPSAPQIMVAGLEKTIAPSASVPPAIRSIIAATRSDEEKAAIVAAEVAAAEEAAAKDPKVQFARRRALARADSGSTHSKWFQIPTAPGAPVIEEHEAREGEREIASSEAAVKEMEATLPFQPSLMPEGGGKTEQTQVAQAEKMGPPEAPVSEAPEFAAPLIASLPYMRNRDRRRPSAQAKAPESAPVQERKIASAEPEREEKISKKKKKSKKNRRAKLKTEPQPRAQRSEVSEKEVPAEPERLGPGAFAPAPARGAEVAVVLTQDHFLPARIHLKEGQPTRLVFTTVNKKPAALVIESLQVQEWVGREPASQVSGNSLDEINREISSSRVTEVVLEPRRGRYVFHDAISGARGEIWVE